LIILYWTGKFASMPEEPTNHENTKIRNDDSCPEWCVGNHPEQALVDDRRHFSRWLRYVPRPNGRQLIVYVEQHVHEKSPVVVVTEEHTDAKEMRYTGEAAAAVSAALLHGRWLIAGDSPAPASLG